MSEMLAGIEMEMDRKTERKGTLFKCQVFLTAFVFFTQFNYTDTKRKKKMLCTVRLVYSEQKSPLQK